MDRIMADMPSFYADFGRKVGENGDNCQKMKDFVKNDVVFCRKTFTMTLVSLWITLWKLGISPFFFIFCVCVFEFKSASQRLQNLKNTG